MQKKVDPIVLKIDSGSNSVKYCGHKNTSPVFLLWYTRIFFVSSFFTIYFSLKCPVSSKGTDVAHKILVIDDEEDFLQALTIRLEHAPGILPPQPGMEKKRLNACIMRNPTSLFLMCKCRKWTVLSLYDH